MRQSVCYSKKEKGKKKKTKVKNLAPSIPFHVSYQEYQTEPGLPKVTLHILPCSLGHI